MSRGAHRHEVFVSMEGGRELAFQHLNHDDILDIAERMRCRLALDDDDSAALTVGLKLLSEVVMMRRDRPPFAELWPALAAFTRALKAEVSAANSITKGSPS